MSARTTPTKLLRRRRISLGLAAAAVCLLATGACSGQPGGDKDAASDSGAVATLALLSDPTSLDPQITSANAVQIPATQIFEGLYAFDAKDVPKPMLADDVKVEQEGKKYTFTLRDVTFHNGSKLTGEDVVASIERSINLPGSPLRVLKSLVTSITAPSANTVAMEFKDPVGNLPSLLASFQAVILPASVVKSAGQTPVAKEGIIGTGPYRLGNWQPGKVLELDRFDGYKPVDSPASGNAGKKEAIIKTLKFVRVPDAGARLAGVRTGQYQWADQMTADLYGTLKDDGKLKLNLLPTGYTALYFNHQSGPTANVKFRQAIQTAVNLDEIGLTQGAHETWKITPEIPNSHVSFASTVGVKNFNVHDADKAKQLIKESGYHGEELVLLATAGSPTGKAMIVVAEQLKAVGLNIKLEEKDLVTGQKLRAQKTGWAMAGGLEGGQVPDATQLPDLPCGNGMGGYCSDRMNAAVQQFVRALTPAEQQAAHDEVQTVYYDEVVSLKLVENFRILVTPSSLKGYQSSSYPAFWNVSLS